MEPTILLSEPPPTKTHSPNIALSELSILDSTLTTQETTTSLINAAAFTWYALSHHQLTMDPTISDLTRQYCNAWEQNGHLLDYYWKQGLLSLPPQIHRQMHQYIIKNGDTPKLPPTYPPVWPPLHWYPHQQVQHPFSTRNHVAVLTPLPYINTLGSTPEVPSTPDQQENIQEILSSFYNLGTSQHIEYHSPQVTTKQEGVEIFILHTPQDLHPDINDLAVISNPSTTMTPYISATTIIPFDISYHTTLLTDYESDLSPSIIQDLVVKR